MAKGRFLSKEIATDRELNVLCSFEADYLFQRCIPHLDVEGRMAGFADVVKATAVPLRRELGEEVVRACLAELQEHGLVRWYDVDNRRYLEFPGFEAHQKGLRKDREAESKCPPANSSDANPVEYSGPTPDLLRMRSAQDKVREVKGSLSEGTSDSLPTVEKSDGEAAVVENSPSKENRWGDTVTACRKHLWLADDPPDGRTIGQELSVAKQLTERWNLDPPEVAEAVEGFAKLRERGFWEGWIERGEPAKMLALNRLPEDEQGIPVVIRSLHEMRKGEPAKRGEGGLERLEVSA